ncbi:MAG: peptidoglycan DD-metalloendopeptidase family protein [Flavobacteriales bacterium]|nr:peptidoglycan DD-metalloendopeptidase family protein [Flavobacteriales bacterium]MCB9191762.1 peptidoglycan DD-metalloendopeptidase family protein [Flavobacteriales bacterium]MCB9203576.1 peptidoglycan DD-metalloendopeptidase family protein [Flavobacteriales bacterium]
MRHIKLILVLLVWAGAAFGQSKTELEKQKKQLLQDIEFTNKLLNETEENKKATLGELNLLSSKINKRQELINTILREVDLVEAQINETRTIVNSLDEDLKRLKEEYALMLYHTYKNQSQYDRLMFILSSEDVNQAYKRIKYFQQYAKHRQEQAAAIEETQKVLESRTEELADKKLKMAYLVEDKEKEKIQLSTEMEEQDKIVANLKQKEGELKRQLQEKQRDAKKLEKAIARIIEEEIRKAKKEAEKTGATVTKSGFALTPVELELSGKFSNDQGKLPWPSERGVITSSFGEHPHPTLPSIKIENNGIDITTDKGSKARTVYEGTVSAVVSIPGAHKAVIVRHGEFLSVYANLEEVLVKMGDKLGVKQSLGTVVTNREDGKTVLHFEIWKGATKLNPAKWIVSKN